MTSRGYAAPLCALALVLASGVVVEFDPRPSHSSETAVTFTDARRQTQDFLDFHRATTLTPDQQRIMDAALGSIPAPCCKQNSIAHCCCPCNLAKSTWGLAKFLITQRHADVATVHTAAVQWLQFVNPHGFSGDACFTGGCARAFAGNGCGGMDDRHLVGE